MKRCLGFSIISVTLFYCVTPTTVSAYENTLEAYESEAQAKSEIIRERLKPGATQNPEYWAKQYREKVYPRSLSLNNATQNNFYSMIQRPKRTDRKISMDRTPASDKKTQNSAPLTPVTVDGSTVRKIYHFGTSNRK